MNPDTVVHAIIKSDVTLTTGFNALPIPFQLLIMVAVFATTGGLLFAYKLWLDKFYEENPRGGLNRGMDI